MQIFLPPYGLPMNAKDPVSARVLNQVFQKRNALMRFLVGRDGKASLSHAMLALVRRLLCNSSPSRFSGSRGCGIGGGYRKRSCGRVTAARSASAARPAVSRYALGSTPQSLADSIRL